MGDFQWETCNFISQVQVDLYRRLICGVASAAGAGSENNPHTLREENASEGIARDLRVCVSQWKQ
jgi:hypothetical protein